MLRCGCGGRQHAAIGGGRDIWEGGLVQVLVHVEVELRVEIEVTNEGEEVCEGRKQGLVRDTRLDIVRN